MKITDTLYAANRETWRDWLAAHHATAKEIWLVYPRKHSGQPRIPYNDAVEEALCFGWVDSAVKGIDADSYAQRFTPRKAGSSYSQTNKERLKRLIAQGKVTPALLDTLRPIADTPYVFPDDILDRLESDPNAWANFQAYSDAYQRIRVAYVDSARKRPPEFEKRMANLIHKSARNRQFGFGIEDYY